MKKYFILSGVLLLAMSLAVGAETKKIRRQEQEKVIDIEGKIRATQEPGEKEAPMKETVQEPVKGKKDIGQNEAKKMKLIEAEEYHPKKKEKKGVNFLRNPALYILLLFGLSIGGNS